MSTDGSKSRWLFYQLCNPLMFSELCQFLRCNLLCRRFFLMVIYISFTFCYFQVCKQPTANQFWFDCKVHHSSKLMQCGIMGYTITPAFAGRWRTFKWFFMAVNVQQQPPQHQPSIDIFQVCCKVDRTNKNENDSSQPSLTKVWQFLSNMVKISLNFYNMILQKMLGNLYFYHVQ